MDTLVAKLGKMESMLQMAAAKEDWERVGEVADELNQLQKTVREHQRD